MPRRSLAVAGLVAVLAAPALIASQELRQADAVRMELKLMAILTRGLQTKAAPLRTSFTEREVNSYFKFNSQNFPTGVVDPRIVIVDSSRLEGMARVDLDAIRRSRPRAALDPINLLGGSLDMKITGTLRASGGMGMLAVESATLGGVPIPKVLLQEVIAYYTKTPELPQGFDLDKPFPLPAAIREVQLQRGAATIVQ
jgi:hypothetical protein